MPHDWVSLSPEDQGGWKGGWACLNCGKTVHWGFQPPTQMTFRIYLTGPSRNFDLICEELIAHQVLES